MHHCDYLCEAFVQPGQWSMKALRKASSACYQLITLRGGRKKKTFWKIQLHPQRWDGKFCCSTLDRLREAAQKRSPSVSALVLSFFMMVWCPTQPRWPNNGFPSSVDERCCNVHHTVCSWLLRLQVLGVSKSFCWWIWSSVYWVAQCYVPENLNLDQHHCENLKFCILEMFNVRSWCSVPVVRFLWGVISYSPVDSYRYLQKLAAVITCSENRGSRLL